tara:strand:- start:403 stop:609 length:207 start_codon:yes stop_codon:yes gene_type:complete
MGLKVNGGFKIGGVEYRHPLTSEEIRFILEIFKKCNFKGEEMENLIVVTMKLQEEYNKVLKKEEQQKK